MTNNVFLMGRLEKVEGEYIFINTTSEFKNENGEYENWQFKLYALDSIIKPTSEYCLKGDLVGVKGRLIKKDNETIVECVKISFLTSNKNALDKYGE